MQEKEFFDDIELVLEPLTDSYLKAMDILTEKMALLRDDFHNEKGVIKEQREKDVTKQFDSGSSRGKKKAWVSRLVLRLYKANVTESKKHKEYSSLKYHQIYFYRSVGINRHEFIYRRKDRTYSSDTLLQDKQNWVTKEEEELLKYVVEQVNLYNAKMWGIKGALVAHLNVLSSIREVI